MTGQGNKNFELISKTRRNGNAVEMQPPTDGLHAMHWPQYIRHDYAIDHASICFNTFFNDKREYVVNAVVNIVPRSKHFPAIQKEIKANTEPEVIEGLKTFLKSI